jgi:hypothetical protein
MGLDPAPEGGDRGAGVDASDPVEAVESKGDWSG